MTTYLVAQDAQCSNQTYDAANLRAWISEIRAALSSVGLVQTSDTGQINPATADAASSSSAGYEIWRFNEVYQGGDPLFIKVTYHRASGNSAWSLYFQVGQGSDGNGNLTGVVSTNQFCGSTNNRLATGTGSGELAAYFDDGIFWLADQIASSCVSYKYARNFVMIARVRSDTNVVNGRGALIFNLNFGEPGANYYGNNTSMQFIRWAPGAELLHNNSRYFGGIVNSAADPSNPSTGDLLAWPFLYYDMGVGVKQAYCAFIAKRNSVTYPVSLTSFNADPFGFGTRTWCSWRWAPNAASRAIPGWSDTYNVAMLPWET